MLKKPTTFIDLVSLKELIRKKSLEKIRYWAKETNIYDFVQLLQQLDEKEQLFVLRCLKTGDSATLFSYLDPEFQEQIIDNLNSKEISNILDSLYSDDLVELLEEMPNDISKRIIAASDKETRKEINQLLRYGEDTAGSLMNIDYIYFRLEKTVANCIDFIKKNIGKYEKLPLYYIVDDGNHLKGYVTAQDLLITDNSKKIEEIMKKEIIFVKTTDDQEKVVEFIKNYDLLEIPVVNSLFELAGVISVDDVIDVIEEEATEDIQRLANITPDRHNYFRSGYLRNSGKRIPWLVFLIISTSLYQFVNSAFLLLFRDSGNFVQGATVFAFVAVLTGIISDTAGNTGSQAVTIVVRGLAIGEIKKTDLLKVVWLESRISLIIGTVLAIIEIPRSLFVYTVTNLIVGERPNGSIIGPEQYGAAISATVAIIPAVLLANIVGGSVPVIAQKLKLDPAIMGVPLLTTITDALSNSVYFLIAFGVFSAGQGLFQSVA